MHLKLTHVCSLVRDALGRSARDVIITKIIFVENVYVLKAVRKHDINKLFYSMYYLHVVHMSEKTE